MNAASSTFTICDISFSFVHRKLAQVLWEVIDTYRWNGEINVPSKTKICMPPVFREPITIACILPGSYYYLHVRKPGKKTSQETEVDQNSHVSFDQSFQSDYLSNCKLCIANERRAKSR